MTTLQVPSTFGDDPQVMANGIDPSIVHQPDMSYEKFITMKNDIVKDHGDMYYKFKQSGSHGEMYSFCNGEFRALSVPMRREGYVERNHIFTIREGFRLVVFLMPRQPTVFLQHAVEVEQKEGLGERVKCV